MLHGIILSPDCSNTPVVSVIFEVHFDNYTRQTLDFDPNYSIEKALPSLPSAISSSESDISRLLGALDKIQQGAHLILQNEGAQSWIFGELAEDILRNNLKSLFDAGRLV